MSEPPLEGGWHQLLMLPFVLVGLVTATFACTVLARPELDVRVVADEFRRVAGPEAGEVVMSTAQELIDQGVQQGQRELLEMQLREKFGKLARSVVDRLEAASADELQTWAKRIVSAKRLDDVFASRRGTASSRTRKK